MLNSIIAAAAAPAAEAANPYGLMEALEQGGVIAWTVFIILVGMSVGTFYVLFTKLIEQQKVINQYKKVRTTFWRSNSLKEGVAKLEKNSAYKQLVDDGIAAQEQHSKLTDPVEAHDWLHGSLARSETPSTGSWAAVSLSSRPLVRPRRSSVCSVRLSVSTAR